MEYITSKEASKKWGISRTRVTILANEGRIPGAKRLGKSWLIPAMATKPPIFKAHHKAASQKEADHFTFPLFHFRPDFSNEMSDSFSKKQHALWDAQAAVLECRFDEAYPLLKSLLRTPDDIVTEIGCLWYAGICCIALNNPKEYSRIHLRLKMLLSEDFPHRDDLVILLDTLDTYEETLDDAAQSYSYNPDIHDQSLPLACMMIGYIGLSKETIKPKSADISLLEITLRFLKTTGAVVATEFMHCYLCGIYCFRQDVDATKKHAKAAVQIAYENKYYLPLVTFYRFYAQVYSPILEQYPQEFQDLLYERALQYEKNYTAFLSSINEHDTFFKLSDADFPYAHGIFMELSNAEIAKKLGVHPQTVKRRLSKLCKRVGVTTKKELRDYLLSHM